MDLSIFKHIESVVLSGHKALDKRDYLKIIRDGFVNSALKHTGML